MPGRAAAEAMPKVSTPGSHMEESDLMTHVVYEWRVRGFARLKEPKLYSETSELEGYKWCVLPMHYGSIASTEGSAVSLRC
eukprot:jgi/Tetstr1/423330/TSEL_014028.t1